MGGKIALNGCSFRSISYANEFSITCQKSSSHYRTVQNQVRTHSRRRVSKSEYVSSKYQLNSLIKLNCYIKNELKIIFLGESKVRMNIPIYIYIPHLICTNDEYRYLFLFGVLHWGHLSLARGSSLA